MFDEFATLFPVERSLNRAPARIRVGVCVERVDLGEGGSAYIGLEEALDQRG